MRTGSRHVRALDGLRGLAILLVIAHHYGGVTFGGGGLYGVEVFFVLSGYLITWLLLGEQARTGRVRLGAFYRRRAVRLLPALAVSLVVFGVIALTVGLHRLATTSNDVFRAIDLTVLYQFNWLGAVDAHWPAALGPLWSLSVEGQFYLIWPLILVFLLRRKVSATSLRLGLAVAAGAFLLTRIATFAMLGDRVYQATWTWGDAFLAGAAVALCGTRNAAWMRLAGRPVPAFLALGVILAGAVLPDAKERAVAYDVGIPLVAVATALLVMTLARSGQTGPDVLPESLLPRIFRSPVLVWFGTRSYSLYLYTYLTLSVVGALVEGHHTEVRATGLALGVTLAELSYRFVETPALRRLLPRPVVLPPATTVPGGVVVAVRRRRPSIPRVVVLPGGPFPATRPATIALPEPAVVQLPTGSTVGCTTVPGGALLVASRATTVTVSD